MLTQEPWENVKVVSSFSAQTPLDEGCVPLAGGQISMDKAGTLSDLEARILCFSAQSNPSEAQQGAPAPGG